eukprot:TRINITY_DN14520_c0_g1_i1.p2 TRINITY_DN14520_c0_g1~~TRINITY_DN14520_c0_g1_i1.p2  ORF type:complete len:193 (+),score=23.05 TRINITY_DN14520_c0_g1_i1:110-688(+)
MGSSLSAVEQAECELQCHRNGRRVAGACAAAGCYNPLPEPAGVEDQRLLSGADRGDYATCVDAINRGAWVDTRRPIVLYSASEGPTRGPRREQGMTPLMRASNGGYREVVQLLLQNQAEVNARDEEGTTALHYAAMSGSQEIAGDLLKFGAKAKVQDANEKTPVDWLPQESTAAEKESWRALLGIMNIGMGR